MKMRFATRAFLWSFIPFALLLAGSFWAIQQRVQNTVRSGLRSSLREAHMSMARLRQESELQNSRFLRIVAENPSLKAGLQLLLINPKSGGISPKPSASIFSWFPIPMAPHWPGSYASTTNSWLWISSE
jgi:hypothetical protein